MASIVEQVLLNTYLHAFKKIPTIIDLAINFMPCVLILIAVKSVSLDNAVLKKNSVASNIETATGGVIEHFYIFVSL